MYPALLQRGGSRIYLTLYMPIVTPANTMTSLCCRSVFLGDIKKAFDKKTDLTNLLLDDFFKSAIHRCQVSTVHVYHNACCLNADA